MSKKERARQIILYAVYITSVCCLQVTFPHVFLIFGRTCDLMLVFVVLAGYLFGTMDGIVVGLIVGMFRDYFSGPVIRGLDGAPVAVLGIGLWHSSILAFFRHLCFVRDSEESTILLFCR